MSNTAMQTLQFLVLETAAETTADRITIRIPEVPIGQLPY